jgi:hypothetical protein
MEEISTISYGDVDEFIDEIFNRAFSEYSSVTVVGDTDFTVEILSKLFALKNTFYPYDISIKSDNYGLYYVDIMDSGKVYCEPVFKNGKIVLSDSPLTYIQNTVSKGVYQYFGDGTKIVFVIKR